jgi:hypothetical protein
MITLLLLLSAAEVPALQPGMGKEAALTALTRGGFGKVQRVLASEPQGLATGLVRSHLLETLNRSSSAPKQDGALDVRAFSEFQFASRGAETCVLAFGPTRASGPPSLRYALLEIAVPIDTADDRPGAPSLRRLHPLKDALATLAGFQLVPKLRDRYGNVFWWHGAKSGVTADVWYLPEADRLRVLLRY